MATKRDLGSALNGNKPDNTSMVRGKPFGLSTDQADTFTPSPEKEPYIKRDNAKIKPTILKQFKLLAVKQDRKLYDVMEEALQKYLDELEG